MKSCSFRTFSGFFTFYWPPLWHAVIYRDKNLKNPSYSFPGFRETERKQWYPQNKEIINKIISRAFPNSSQTLPHIHVLDLEATGHIKPHVDSVRYCGTTISGISLLSDSVMKLVQTTEDHSASSDYRNQSKPTEEELKNLYSVKILLKRFSLYIMSHSARYNFTHEILKNEESFIKGEQILKNRRISIICRNEP